MPQRTLGAIVRAHEGVKEAKKAHDAVRDELLTIVLRVMGEVYHDDPDKLAKIQNPIQHRQVTLGPKFEEVALRCQNVCGISLPDNEVRKFTRDSIALDIAMALNNEGTELGYDTVLFYEDATETNAVSTVLGISQEQIVPWMKLGPKYRDVIDFIHRSSDLRCSLPDPSPETTFHELNRSLKSPE